MTDTDKTLALTDGRKVTFGYERKHNLGNYESETVSMYMTDYVPEGRSPAEFVEQVGQAAIDTLKVNVWTALNLDWDFTEDGTPVLHQQPSPQAVEQQHRVAPPTAPPPPAPVPVQPTQSPRRDMPTTPQVGYYPDMPSFCKECGNREFYDNRADNDAKLQAGKKVSPDWKCKSCGKGVWRNGTFDYNEQVGKRQQPVAQTPPPMTQPDPDEVPF